MTRPARYGHEDITRAEMERWDRRRVYVATGPVRGDCGHRHRRLTRAMLCVDRDARACPGSDRTIIRRSDGSTVETEPGDGHGAEAGCCVSELDIRPEDTW